MAEQCERVFNDKAILEKNYEEALDWSESVFVWNSRLVVLTRPDLMEQVSSNECQ